MKGLALVFNKTGCDLNPNAVVQGFQAVVQNGMVNIGTAKGSDPLYADRGTDLLKSATSGIIISDNAASHVANIASVDTLFFCRETDPSTDPDKLASVGLLVSLFSANLLELEASFVSLSGRKSASQPH